MPATKTTPAGSWPAPPAAWASRSKVNTLSVPGISSEPLAALQQHRKRLAIMRTTMAKKQTAAEAPAGDAPAEAKAEKAKGEKPEGDKPQKAKKPKEPKAVAEGG